MTVRFLKTEEIRITDTCVFCEEFKMESSNRLLHAVSLLLTLLTVQTTLLRERCEVAIYDLGEQGDITLSDALLRNLTADKRTCSIVFITEEALRFQTDAKYEILDASVNDTVIGKVIVLPFGTDVQPTHVQVYYAIGNELPSAAQQTGDKLGTGSVVGIVVGIIVCALLLVVLVILLMNRYVPRSRTLIRRISAVRYSRSPSSYSQTHAMEERIGNKWENEALQDMENSKT